MLENIIYHTIAIVFITYLAILLFLLSKQYKLLKTCMIPFLLKKEFSLPRDRSLFVRNIRALEELMTKEFERKFCIIYDSSRMVFFYDEFEYFFNLVFSNKKRLSAEYVQLAVALNKLSKSTSIRDDQKFKNKTIVLRQKSNVELHSDVLNLDFIFHKNDRSFWEVSIL